MGGLGTACTAGPEDDAISAPDVPRKHITIEQMSATSLAAELGGLARCGGRGRGCVVLVGAVGLYVVSGEEMTARDSSGSWTRRPETKRSSEVSSQFPL
jgi:hypothetical protein